MHYIKKKKKKTFSYKSIFINKPNNKGYLLFFGLISSFMNNQTKLYIINLMTNWKLHISSKDKKHFLLNLMWYVFSILWNIIQNKNTCLFIIWWLRVPLFQENYPNFFLWFFIMSSKWTCLKCQPTNNIYWGFNTQSIIYNFLRSLPLNYFLNITWLILLSSPSIHNKFMSWIWTFFLWVKKKHIIHHH